MQKRLVSAVTFGVVSWLIVIGLAHAGDPAESALLGRDPGSKTVYACFARHYDAAHLAAHPRQNVRNMSMFVASRYDDGQRIDSIDLGFHFRGVKRVIEASGDCSTINGETGLTCGIDCDGGHFSVATYGAAGALVSIPDGINIYDPQASDEDPEKLPKGADFGSDDQSFELQRVDTAQCKELMDDDAKAAVLGTGRAAK